MIGGSVRSWCGQVQVRTELGVGGVGELGHGHQLTAKLPAQSYGAQKVLFYPNYKGTQKKVVFTQNMET